MTISRPLRTALWIGSMAVGLLLHTPPSHASFDLLLDALAMQRWSVDAPESRVRTLENRERTWLLTREGTRLYLYAFDPSDATRRLWKSPALPMHSSNPAALNASPPTLLLNPVPGGAMIYYVLPENTGQGGIVVLPTPEGGFATLDAALPPTPPAPSAPRPSHAMRAKRTNAPPARDITVTVTGEVPATVRAAFEKQFAQGSNFPAPEGAQAYRFTYHAEPAHDLASTLLQLHQQARTRPQARAAARQQLTAQLADTDLRTLPPSPALTEALNDFGYWALGAGDPVQAIALLDAVIQRDPQRAAAYLNRADAWRTVVAKVAMQPAQATRRWPWPLASSAERFDEEKEELPPGLRQALEDDRQYCHLRRLASEPIPRATTARLLREMQVSSLDERTCLPRWQIFAAMAQGDTARVQALLDAGVEPDTRNFQGDVPLYAALKANQPAMAELLLARGAHPNLRAHGEPLLFRAFWSAKPRFGSPVDFTLPELMLRHGADIDQPDNPQRDGRTQLMVRADSFPEDREISTWLLAHGADIQRKSAKGCSLLHYAVKSSKNLWMVQELMQRGLTPNTACPYSTTGDAHQWPISRTPLSTLLHLMEFERNNAKDYAESLRMMQALLAAGADPRLGGAAPPGTVGSAAFADNLGYAASIPDPELFDQLVAAAPTGTPIGFTPLNRALYRLRAPDISPPNAAREKQVRENTVRIIDRLLVLEAEVNPPANAEHAADSSNLPLRMPDILDLPLYQRLLDAGADPSLRDDYNHELPLITLIERNGYPQHALALIAHPQALWKTPQICGKALSNLLDLQTRWAQNALYESRRLSIDPAVRIGIDQLIARLREQPCDTTEYQEAQARWLALQKALAAREPH